MHMNSEIFQSVDHSGRAWWAALSLEVELSGKAVSITMNLEVEWPEQEAAVTLKALPLVTNPTPKFHSLLKCHQGLGNKCSKFESIRTVPFQNHTTMGGKKSFISLCPSEVSGTNNFLCLMYP